MYAWRIFSLLGFSSLDNNFQQKKVFAEICKPTKLEVMRSKIAATCQFYIFAYYELTYK